MRHALALLFILSVTAACENRYGHEVHYVKPTPITAVSATNTCNGVGCQR